MKPSTLLLAVLWIVAALELRALYTLRIDGYRSPVEPMYDGEVFLYTPVTTGPTVSMVAMCTYTGSTPIVTCGNMVTK